MGSSSEADLFVSHSFTHIVVGGGTAGLVVAARLSESPALTVGILEAGPVALDEPTINVPGRLAETLFTKYDWQFETTPQPGLNGRKLSWNRGKVLGGSSALNYMMWCRGSRDDYDNWEKLGNEGWGWKGMLPFFKKSERFHAPTREYQARHQAYYDLEDHGTDGPLHIIYSEEYGASQQYWHATLNKLGVETNPHHASGENIGCWTASASVDPSSQERCYSAPAYYVPAAKRDNLLLLAEATAREIVLENGGNDWAAKGVKFAHKGSEYTVRADCEVILSAGTVQSPQLLELSGIGNPEILRAAEIEVKIENPNVGENLQEHMASMMVYEIDPSISTAEALRSDPALAKVADDEYAATQSGPRTRIGYSAAYLPLSHYISPSEISALVSKLPPAISPSAARQRDQILAQRFSSSNEKAGQMEFLFDVGNYSPFYTSQPNKRYGTMVVMLQFPFSIGSTHIPEASFAGQPSTSDESPVIDPKYYAGPAGEVDFLGMVAAQKFGHKICSTPPLADMIVERVCPPAPTSTHAGTDSDEDSDEDFSAWVRDNTTTGLHSVGTCAMGGSAGKADGVVDSRLRVYGVRGLRVVDASIMPMQISAHLQATVYAIGEKGASMIMEDWEAARG